jgi:hypothetical protein
MVVEFELRVSHIYLLARQVLWVGASNPKVKFNRKLQHIKSIGLLYSQC